MKAPPPKVEKVFDCPFCNHSKTVEVKLQRPQKKATLRCRICKETYDFNITKLMLEVDVFCRWIDECQRINEPVSFGGASQPKTERLGFTDKGPQAEKKNTPYARAFSSDEDDDDDDDLDSDDDSDDVSEDDDEEKSVEKIVPQKKGPSFGAATVNTKKRLRPNNVESEDEKVAVKRVKQNEETPGEQLHVDEDDSEDDGLF